MKLDLIVRTSALAAATVLLSQPSAAQQKAGSVFLEIFNIDGSAETLGTQDGEGVGSIGCGGGDGGTMNSIDTSSAQDLFHFCSNLTKNSGAGWASSQAADPNGGVQAMQEGLAPDELFMQSDQAAALATVQINNVSQRIEQIRLARRGLENLGGYAFERGGPTGPVLGMTDTRLHAPESNLQGGAFAAALQRGFSSGDGFLGIEGVSAFVNAEYTRLDASSTSHEVGSDGNGGSFTVGIDKQLGESAFLGLAFGYSYLTTDFHHNFGDSRLNDITFSTYGSAFFGEHVYVDGIVSGSILLFDQTRSVPSGGVVGTNFGDLDSDPEGWSITGDFGIGGEFSLKPFDLNPYLRVAVSQTEIDSFNEHGSSLALKIDDQDVTSVILRPGLSVSLPVSTSFGVVSPYLRGEYVHEFGDQAADIRGNLRLIPDASFKLTPNGTDEDYATAGAGVTSTLGQGISVFAEYNILLGFSDLIVQTATIGGRLEF